MEHKIIPAESRHGPNAWEVTNQTARLALSTDSDDIGKTCWQKSDDTLWLLKDVDTWAQYGRNGTNGADGEDGTDGTNGTNGANGSDAGKVLDEFVLTGPGSSYTISGSSPAMITVDRSGSSSIVLPTRATDPTLQVRRPYLVRTVQDQVTTFSAGSGASILKEAGREDHLSTPHAPVTAMLVSDTAWWLFGALDIA